MIVTAIIAEYNPFHNGHHYQIAQARKITNADYIIVVMSGNFSQRGNPALIDKYTRSQMALSCGVNLVLELPIYYACGSAEYFARGAISLLNSLGIVDYLSFGSECGNIENLTTIAEALFNESKDFSSILISSMKKGLTFPQARMQALEQTLDDFHSYSSILANPNNLLGIEYIKALHYFNSSIKPSTIKRVGSNYHDLALIENNSSATAIRKIIEEEYVSMTKHTSAKNRLKENDLNQTNTSNLLAIPNPMKNKTEISKQPYNTNLLETPKTIKNNIESITEKTASLTQIKDQVPPDTLALLEFNFNKSFPQFPDDISNLLHYKLLLHMKEGYSSFVDISDGLSSRIKNNVLKFTTFSNFCNLLKTKDMTYSRISRCLLHILLDIKKEKLIDYTNNGYIFYGRMLGFRLDSTSLLSSIKKESSIPLISKLADAKNTLTPLGLQMLEEDMHATHIYNSLVTSNHSHLPANEYCCSPVKL